MKYITYGFVNKFVLTDRLFLGTNIPWFRWRIDVSRWHYIIKASGLITCLRDLLDNTAAMPLCLMYEENSLIHLPVDSQQWLVGDLGHQEPIMSWKRTLYVCTVWYLRRWDLINVPQRKKAYLLTCAPIDLCTVWPESSLLSWRHLKSLIIQPYQCPHCPHK